MCINLAAGDHLPPTVSAVLHAKVVAKTAPGQAGFAKPTSFIDTTLARRLNRAGAGEIRG